jgi:CPA2 family monovalent cation:H+ antiporter-2
VHPLRDAFAAIFFFAFGLSIDPGVVTSVAGPVAAAAAVTIVMNVVAGLLVARLYGYGAQPAADIATTLVARGEFALILGAMAASAGLDARLAPFIAGYVLVLAVLGPVAAGRAHLPARLLGSRRARKQADDAAPAPVSVAVGADAER